MENTMDDTQMSVEERRARLSKIARESDFTRRFHASDVNSAIDLLNKMDNLYKQQVEVTHKAVHTFIFMLPDGTRFIPELSQDTPQPTRKPITDQGDTKLLAPPDTPPGGGDGYL